MLTSTRYKVKRFDVEVVREAPPEPGPDTRGRLKLSSPEAVAAIARQIIPDDAREHFWVLFLNAQNGLVGCHEVSVGSLSASIVHPREVFRMAVGEVPGVSALILVHNHPSGDVTPSKEDVHLTRQLADGAKLLGLRVHDHIIITHGSDDFTSFVQKGLI